MTDREGSGDTNGDEMGLEARLDRLEAILGQLQAGDVDLEKALALFEEGVGHVRKAEGLIARTELKVEELLATGETRPVDGDEA